jgi:hypothetical protein
VVEDQERVARRNMEEGKGDVVELKVEDRPFDGFRLGVF